MTIAPESGEHGISVVGLDVLTQPRIAQINMRKPKFIDPALIQQAIANNPLETMPRWQFSDEVKAASVFRQVLPELRTSFLQTHFLILADNGITFEMPLSEVKNKVQELGRQKAHLAEYYQSVHVSFEVFQQIFSFLEFIIEKGKFEEKHLTSIHSICTAYASINDVERGARLMKPIGLQVAFNRERYIFELPTVFSVSNLPEILFAMPVCFMGVAQSEDANDPLPSSKLRMLCDLVGSQNFAWFYQMYNRRDRSIADFKGPDPIPSDYLAFRPQLQPLVDLELIATPYHQIASREWADPSWVASIDPVALGLYADLPFFTMFKRWSGSGIFPLLADLMADTANHIKTHASKLNEFKRPYWYKGSGAGLSVEGNQIALFAKNVVKQFEEGTVFQFLRA